MRLLQVITDTDRRGAQVFACDLGEALVARGHAVETVALVPGSNAVGLEVELLGPNRIEATRALRRRLRGFDAVIAHGSSTLISSAAATVGTGVPFVYRQISDTRFWASTRFRRLRVRVCLERAARIVALAPGARDDLADHIGVDVERISVVPNGIPEGGFEPADPAGRAAARRALGLDPGRPTVLYAGAFAEEKGVDVAIEAVAALEDVALVLAGAGPERTALEQLAEQVAPGRVHFLGSVPELGPVYAAADVLVLPSRGGDSMPAVLIEAGFCGLPVVATDVGAIGDVVLDGRTGRVLPTAEPGTLGAELGELLGDPQRADRWGREARAHCLAHFEIRPVAEGWERCLELVVR